MGKEKGIPQFQTCPICNKPKLSSKVTYDAVLDGKEVKICGSCKKKHSRRMTKRQQLLED